MEKLEMDADAAESLGRRMNDDGKSFSERSALLTGQLAGVQWTGSYANDFRVNWENAREQMAGVVSLLEGTGQTLTEHAMRQRAVSEGDVQAAAGGLLVGAGVTAAVLAQGRRAQRPGAQAGGQNQQNYRVLGNAQMSDNVRQAVGRMSDTYHAETGEGLTVTGGNRTPARQADLMADTMDENGRMAGYSDSAAVRELARTYNQTSALPNSTPESVRQAMTTVIENQITRDVYVSDHLRAGAVDIRSTDMNATEAETFQRAARAEGFRVVDERWRVNRPHWHLELDNPRR